MVKRSIGTSEQLRQIIEDSTCNCTVHDYIDSTDIEDNFDYQDNHNNYRVVLLGCLVRSYGCWLWSLIIFLIQRYFVFSHVHTPCRLYTS